MTGTGGPEGGAATSRTVRAPEPVLRPTGVGVAEFLATVDDRRRGEAEALIELMRDISGEEPRMWGPSIIGFGHVRYRLPSGREGDMGALGFSPRKAAVTVYIPEGFDRYADLLARLGKHRTGASCLYLTRLADADPQVLRELLVRSHRRQVAPDAKPTTVAEYLAAVPAGSRAHLDELRELVHVAVPEAVEVLSYGILGYRADPVKRARVFASGWRDHVALYPVPRDPDLADGVAPYVRGRGTLWFPLDQPLPRDLVVAVVRALFRDTVR